MHASYAVRRPFSFRRIRTGTEATTTGTETERRRRRRERGNESERIRKEAGAEATARRRRTKGSGSDGDGERGRERGRKKRPPENGGGGWGDWLLRIFFDFPCAHAYYARRGRPRGNRGEKGPRAGFLPGRGRGSEFYAGENFGVFAPEIAPELAPDGLLRGLTAPEITPEDKTTKDAYVFLLEVDLIRHIMNRGNGEVKTPNPLKVFFFTLLSLLRFALLVGKVGFGMQRFESSPFHLPHPPLVATTFSF